MIAVELQSINMHRPQIEREKERKREREMEGPRIKRERQTNS